MDAEERDARTARIAGVGAEGRRRISAGRVLVVGAGGLGSPVLQYLAAAGVGCLGIADPDVVAASNLPRQLVHAGRVGRGKTESAARAVRELHPGVEVVEHPVAVTAENALELLAGWDVVVDATDSPATRYVVSDAAAILGVPEVWGAALGLEGQVTVFGAGPDGPVDYRDLHPTPPLGEPDTCETVGVLGPVCGAIGSVMAAEAMKLLTGLGDPLIGRVLHYDGGAARWHEIPLHRRADREAVTAMVAGDEATSVREIGWSERGDRVIVDVREPAEQEVARVEGALLLPLGELLADPSRAGAAPVLVYCASGRRSRIAAARLVAEGVDAVSLRGGVSSVPHPELAGP